jgi:hypothetical protein
MYTEIQKAQVLSDLVDDLNECRVPRLWALLATDPGLVEAVLPELIFVFWLTDLTLRCKIIFSAKEVLDKCGVLRT